MRASVPGRRRAGFSGAHHQRRGLDPAVAAVGGPCGEERVLGGGGEVHQGECLAPVDTSHKTRLGSPRSAAGVGGAAARQLPCAYAYSPICPALVQVPPASTPSGEVSAIASMLVSPQLRATGSVASARAAVRERHSPSGVAHDDFATVLGEQRVGVPPGLSASESGTPVRPLGRGTGVGVQVAPPSVVSASGEKWRL